MPADTMPGGDAVDAATDTERLRKTIEADERQTERQAPDNASPGEGPD
jgi:hypothetical protein